MVHNSNTGRIYKVDAKNSENITQVMVDQNLQVMIDQYFLDAIEKVVLKPLTKK